MSLPQCLSSNSKQVLLVVFGLSATVSLLGSGLVSHDFISSMTGHAVSRQSLSVEVIKATGQKLDPSARREVDTSTFAHSSSALRFSVDQSPSITTSQYKVPHYFNPNSVPGDSIFANITHQDVMLLGCMIALVSLIAILGLVPERPSGGFSWEFVLWMRPRSKQNDPETNLPRTTSSSSST